MNIGGASLIGIIGAVVCSAVQELMDRYGKKYVDDTLDVWAAHGVGEWTHPSLNRYPAPGEM